jgi:hypothetical protein
MNQRGGQQHSGGVHRHHTNRQNGHTQQHATHTPIGMERNGAMPYVCLVSHRAAALLLKATKKRANKTNEKSRNRIWRKRAAEQTNQPINRSIDRASERAGGRSINRQNRQNSRTHSQTLIGRDTTRHDTHERGGVHARALRAPLPTGHMQRRDSQRPEAANGQWERGRAERILIGQTADRIAWKKGQKTGSCWEGGMRDRLQSVVRTGGGGAGGGCGEDGGQERRGAGVPGRWAAAVATGIEVGGSFQLGRSGAA